MNVGMGEKGASVFDDHMFLNSECTEKLIQNSFFLIFWCSSFLANPENLRGGYDSRGNVDHT